MTAEVRWVTWNGTKVAHAAAPHTSYRVGSYPVACGVFTPDAWDVGTHYEAGGMKRRCRRCEKVLAARERADAKRTPEPLDDRQLANAYTVALALGDHDAAAYALNEIVVRLGLDPDETEQGLTATAAAAVLDFTDTNGGKR